MPDPDPVATYLAQIRERMNQRLTIPVTPAMAMRGAIESARDIPRLLAAVDAVLAVHRRAPGHDGRDRCAWCRTSRGVREPWPCGEYQAISAELLGEEAGQ